jgi:hypothetical protein
MMYHAELSSRASQVGDVPDDALRADFVGGEEVATNAKRALISDVRKTAKWRHEWETGIRGDGSALNYRECATKGTTRWFPKPRLAAPLPPVGDVRLVPRPDNDKSVGFSEIVRNVVTEQYYDDKRIDRPGFGACTSLSFALGAQLCELDAIVAGVMRIGRLDYQAIATLQDPALWDLIARTLPILFGSTKFVIFGSPMGKVDIAALCANTHQLSPGWIEAFRMDAANRRFLTNHMSQVCFGYLELSSLGETAPKRRKVARGGGGGGYSQS